MSNTRLDKQSFRIVFLGTPEFALPSIRALAENGYNIVGVVCQPDKPVGRSQALTPPPAKRLALELGIPVLQFASIKSEMGQEALSALNADLGIVAAFGQMLSDQNINTPRLGMINIHGSLLPKYRGASPIQRAVIDGAGTTGVTIQQVKFVMDTGDVLLQKPMDILPEETSGELFKRMSFVGASALLEILPDIIAGEAKPIEQDDAQATYCSLLKKEDGKLDFAQTAGQVHDRIRGVNPWPGAYCHHGEQTLKIWAARVVQTDLGGAPGQVLASSPKEGFVVACGSGAVELLEVQGSGSKRLGAKAYLLGNRLSVGEILC